MSLRRRLNPVIRVFHQFHSRRTRAMTLGVRGLVTDEAGRVLLIRHTYTHGWFMPGGGVERGETAAQAVARELEEEAGVRPTSAPVLVSIHSAERHFRGDHILLYRITAWEACRATSIGEIEEVAWFAPDALPDDITPGTRARITEALKGTDPHPNW